jgi:hypothetical protein
VALVTVACSPDRFSGPRRQATITNTRTRTSNITLQSPAFISRSARTNLTIGKVLLIYQSSWTGQPRLEETLKTDIHRARSGPRRKPHVQWQS